VGSWQCHILHRYKVLPVEEERASILLRHCPFVFEYVLLFPSDLANHYGLPRWCGGKKSSCQCRRSKRLGFSPWVGEIPWSRKWQSLLPKLYNFIIFVCRSLEVQPLPLPFFFFFCFC
jgi:hypothetical protein